MYKMNGGRNIFKILKHSTVCSVHSMLSTCTLILLVIVLVGLVGLRGASFQLFTM